MKTVSDLLGILILSGLFFISIAGSCFLMLLYEIRMNRKRDEIYKNQLNEIIKSVNELVNKIKQ